MSIGDYGQKERKNNRRYQYGSKSLQIAWDALFHKGANYGFEITSEVLIKLLSKAELFTNDSLREIIDAYVKSCEETSQYPWRYYYVKYKAYRDFLTKILEEFAGNEQLVNEIRQAPEVYTEFPGRKIRKCLPRCAEKYPPEKLKSFFLQIPVRECGSMEKRIL